MGDSSLKIPSFEDGGLWRHPLGAHQGWRHYRVGTVTGLWRDVDGAYEILTIINDAPGNGHTEAVFAHFFTSCKRDNRDLIIRQVISHELAEKLIHMKFTALDEDDFIKKFKENKK